MLFDWLWNLRARYEGCFACGRMDTCEDSVSVNWYCVLNTLWKDSKINFDFNLSHESIIFASGCFVLLLSSLIMYCEWFCVRDRLNRCNLVACVCVQGEHWLTATLRNVKSIAIGHMYVQILLYSSQLQHFFARVFKVLNCAQTGYFIVKNCFFLFINTHICTHDINCFLHIYHDSRVVCSKVDLYAVVSALLFFFKNTSLFTVLIIMVFCFPEINFLRFINPILTSFIFSFCSRCGSLSLYAQEAMLIIGCCECAAQCSAR